jgi:flagellar secretion chaperone FliS
MANVAYPNRAYQTTEAATADPRHLVVLLFDAMVRDLHRAREAMADGDHEAQCQGILRTQRVLSALLTALDEGADPLLARRLFALYNWLHGKLTEASVGDDLALLDEVADIVTAQRDAWRQAEANCLKADPPKTTAASPFAASGSVRSAA